VEKSVNAVHEFARELRPALLDDLGLIPALHAYIKIMSARTNLKINLSAFSGVENLNGESRTVLYRVAQESLTNVTRHAHASAVDISIRRLAGVVRMEVHDNGRSFSVEQMLSARTNKRLGLLGMRERVEMVGGTFLIESAPEHGTTVRVEMPWTKGGAQ
jgi:signal transduction histidine kinase